MRVNIVVAICACATLAACGGWKSGQANSAQGNISKDSRPPATSKASAVTNQTNGMVMLAVFPVKGPEAARIMHARHEGMETLGDATKAIHRALAGATDLATVRSNAATVSRLSQQASEWFPLGTGPEAGKTGAKPEIWQNSEDFASKLRNFQAAAQAFSAAVSSRDTAAINARFAQLGGTCKACHDKYRAEQHH
jgi:cytochrome c556